MVPSPRLRDTGSKRETQSEIGNLLFSHPIHLGSAPGSPCGFLALEESSASLSDWQSKGPHPEDACIGEVANVASPG